MHLPKRKRANQKDLQSSDGEDATGHGASHAEGWISMTEGEEMNEMDSG